MNNTIDLQHEAQSTRSVSQFMSMVYMIMAFCLLITLGVAYGVTTHPALEYKIISSNNIFYGLLFAQLACVLFFRSIARNVGAIGAALLLVVYSVLTGMTLSIIALIYTSASIVQTLAICVSAFVALSAYGYVTKRDISEVGSFCYMGLCGLVLLGLASLFIPAMQTSAVQLALSAVGILVFSGITAYDTKNLKSLYSPQASQEANRQLALFGALHLYLDFINLFLDILSFTGKRK